MKYLFLLGFSVIVLSVSGQQSVTLDQCYEWAEKNYPKIKQFDLIEKTMQYDLSNASKAWLPQVSLTAKATYQSDMTQLPLDFSQLPDPMKSFSVPELSKDQYQVAAEVSQTIWDGGITRSSQMITRAEAEVEHKKLESELYSIKERINQLYFGCILQDDLLKQNRLLQKELQVNLDRIKAMIANGVANDSDRELLEVEILNVRQKEIELTASRSSFVRMLAYFTGQDITENTIIETPVTPVAGRKQEINRPELQSFDANLSVADMRDKMITASLMPKFGAFVQAGYGRPGLNMLDDGFDSFYIAGITMSWNLGRLYTLKNDRRKVNAIRNQVNINKETFLFNTQMQLIQQDENIQQIKALMQTDDEIVRLRTNVRKAAEVKLENGTISVSDLVREINAEDMAKQTATLRRTQHLMAIYQLIHITNNK